MINDYGAVGGMKIGRGIANTRREPTPEPLSLPQIPYTWSEIEPGVPHLESGD
jgi:hypothetical protein